MRIGIDVYSFGPPNENYGVGPSVYVWHLLPKLIEHGKDIQFYVFGNKENEALITKSNNVRIIINPLPIKIRSARIIHEQLFVPFFAKKYNLDLIHFLGNNISFILAKRSIITIHDLMWNYYLKLGKKKLKYFYFRLSVPFSIKNSKRIITVSNYIKNEIQTLYNIEEKKIKSVYEAAGALPKLSKPLIEQYKKRYQFTFIFSVTTIMPHKNVITLLKAFSLLKKNGKYKGKLIIAGQLKGNYFPTIKKIIIEHDITNDVVFTGFISDEHKTFLYHACDVFVYPSLYEGFGLPVLEAMSMGIPVVASKAASIPEVGGDACLYFDPLAVEDLKNKIQSVIENESTRKDLIEKGFANLAKFSWGKTANETLEVYNGF